MHKCHWSVSTAILRRARTEHVLCTERGNCSDIVQRNRMADKVGHHNLLNYGCMYFVVAIAGNGACTGRWNDRENRE